MVSLPQHEGERQPSTAVRSCFDHSQLVSIHFVLNCHINVPPYELLWISIRRMKSIFMEVTSSAKTSCLCLFCIDRAREHPIRVVHIVNRRDCYASLTEYGSGPRFQIVTGTTFYPFSCWKHLDTSDRK